jgi:aminobenzoyl-glutamate utilization protein B
MQNTDKVWTLVEAKRQEFLDLADRIWDKPEIAYDEYESTAEHTAMLEQQGFRITREVAGIPTAVMGEAGVDGPIIAILGEYDALPGLSQEAGIAEKKPSPETASATAAATTSSAAPPSSPPPP